jgi:hypothetical protein
MGVVDLLAIADRLLYSISNTDDQKLITMIALSGASLHIARCDIFYVSIYHELMSYHVV